MHRKKIKGESLTDISIEQIAKRIFKKKKSSQEQRVSIVAYVLLFFVLLLVLFHFYRGFIATRQTIMSLNSTRQREEKKAKRRKRRRGSVDLPQLQLVWSVRQIALVASWSDSREFVDLHLNPRFPGLILLSPVSIRIITIVHVSTLLLVLDETFRLVPCRCHQIDFLDRSAWFLKEIDTDAVNGCNIFADLMVNRGRAFFKPKKTEKTINVRALSRLDSDFVFTETCSETGSNFLNVSHDLLYLITSLGLI